LELNQQKPYENQSSLEQYLLFHYGSELDLMPFAFGPKGSLHFPVRCVIECLGVKSFPLHAKALDLGCAVGRSTFELSCYCEKVTGIDISNSFIQAAKEIQQKGLIQFSILGEGTERLERVVRRPHDCHPERIHFKCTDVMGIFLESDTYNIVLAANLICRLKEPLSFLNQISEKIVPGGQLIITSPYSWLEEYTAVKDWPSNESKPITFLKESLGKNFELKHVVDIPFVIREHYRKYQWGVSQASVWKRI
jgi:putative 4-mercaptohistidine N1-methyltranferase